jgi:hypothetical protein
VVPALCVVVFAGCRSFRLFRYRACFVASEAVDWLVGANKAADRLQGVQLGRLLQASGYLHHVVDDHDFKDEFLYFRFFCGESLLANCRNRQGMRWEAGLGDRPAGVLESS